MAAASTLSTVSYIYKSTYAGDLGDVARRRHTLLAMMKKTGGFTGSGFKYPMKYANPGAVSGTFSRAQANAGASKGVQFEALRFKKYGVITLDGEALQACDSKGSFLDLVTLETDSVITEMQSRLAFDLYRDGSGQRGQRLSISGNEVLLANVDDARNFEVGMTLIADDTATGLSPRTGTTTVTAVSLSDGKITLASAAALVGFADNDFLFADGDPGTCVEGMEVCTPLAKPALGVDVFRTKDRGVYPERLAGSRIDDTSTVLEENAGKLAVSISSAGGEVDSMICNPTRFYQIVRRLGAKVEYESAGGEATYGFERIMIATAAGTLKVYSDPDCPTNRFREFLAASHYIRTLDDFTHVIMDDGKAELRSTDADSVEARIRAMGNYIQTDTRNHGVGSI